MTSPKLTAEHERILAALAELGLSDREAERRAEIPQGFLAKARAGAREGAKAEASWASLARLAAPAAVAPSSPPQAQSGAPDAPPSDVVLAIRDATTLEGLDALQRRILEAVAAPPPANLAPTVARALNEIIKERRQLLIAIAQERNAARAGEPVRIEVVFVDDWMPPPDPGGAP